MDDPDITGWSEERILRWEQALGRFATEKRANEAQWAWEKANAEALAESERWRDYYNEEFDRKD